MKKRVLILIPNLGRGGAQTVFRQQLTHLSSKYEVFGCVFNWDDSFSTDRADRTIYSLEVRAGKTIFAKALNFFSRVRRLNKLKKELNIDLCISHLEGADYVNILSQSNDRSICWIHGSKHYDQNINGLVGGIRKRILIPFLYRRASQIITVSKEIKTELIKVFNIPDQQIQTVHNGFNLTSIAELKNAPLRDDYSELKKNPVLITHCRLALQKNLTGLLMVVSEVMKIKKIKLVILGDGELRDELLTLSKNLNLKTFSIWENEKWNSDYDVFFMGHISNPYPFLKNSSLYIMTSDWEGFPLALCEALACELPVISSDCYTGPREILAPSLNIDKRVTECYYGEYGMLMPFINSKSKNILNVWSLTILNFLENKQLQDTYKMQGRKRVADFDITESTSATVRAIEDFLTS